MAPLRPPGTSQLPPDLPTAQPPRDLALHRVAASSDAASIRAEKVARDTLNIQFGRATTDAEWATARARLLEFVTILRSWDLPVATDPSETGNVILIPPPRPCL